MSSTTAVAPGRLRLSPYVLMGVVMLLSAVLGFMPTFWLPMSRGAFTSPVILIHGVLFTTWTLLFAWQAWLVSSRQVAEHREFGVFGVAVMTAVAIFAVMAAINQSYRAAGAGDLTAGLRFMIIPISSLTLFLWLAVPGILLWRRPDWHKRLLLYATASLMSGAVGRLILYIQVFGGHMPVPAGMPSPPPPVGWPGLPDAVLLLYVVVPIAIDYRSRGKLHPAGAIALSANLAVLLLQPVISRTDTWLSVARFIYALST